MNSILRHLDRAGGDVFIRDYQPGWEAKMAQAGLTLRDRRIPTFAAVVPTSFSAQWLATTLFPYLTQALYKVLQYVLSHPIQRETLLTSLTNRQELMLLDVNRLPRLADIFGRFDTFLHYENGMALPRVIEANFNNVEGLLFSHVSAQGGQCLLEELGLRQSYTFPSALWQLWHWFLRRYACSRPAPEVPTLGIIWEPGHLVKDVELVQAAELFRRWGYELGIQVILGSWQMLDHTSQSGWTLKGRPIHILWKNIGPFYPQTLGESVYGRLPHTDPSELCVLSDILGRLLGSKWLLEGLWNEKNRFLFTAKEWQAIQLLVPWTAEVVNGYAVGPDGQRIPDMLRCLSRHKDALVLKPVLGSHGEGVYVGIDTEQTVWDQALGQALGGGWIVMTFVSPEQVTLPVADPDDDWQVIWRKLYADCNFYVFGGRCGAVVRRASQDRILNVAQKTVDGRPAGGLLISANSVW